MEPSPTTTAETPEEAYRQRLAEFSSRHTELRRQDRRLGRWRLLVFLLAAACLGTGWIGGWIAAYVAGATVLVGFVALITWHDAVTREAERVDQICRIHREALARIHRDWDALPLIKTAIPGSHRAVATDLDLFGHASVFHLICAARTPIGVRILRDWLLDPAPPAEILARQQAVQQLAPLAELREQLQLETRLLAGGGEAIERFIEWAESPTWLQARPWLRWSSRGLPLAALLSAVLTLSGLLPLDVGGSLVAASLLAAFLISVLFTGTVHEIFNRVSRRRGEARRYLRAFELLASLPDSLCGGTSAPQPPADSASDTPARSEPRSLLDELQQDVARRGGGVLPQLRKLERIMALANVRQDPTLFLLVYLPLQLLGMYDLHVLDRLEGWQRRHGAHVRHWLQSLGCFEALASLATLAHDNPDWSLPVVEFEAARFAATRLGHPLLPDRSRVTNDVQLGPTGTFLLVTGSNMSGKSTLLRSIGVNAVLAQAGAPVCAARLAMPPLRVATSMRIHDSLEDGVSFFMAELKRLKSIVDLARQLDQRDDLTLLYLLDEILQGTNSHERHIAVVHVVAHLLKHRAIGAISTHDLTLAASDSLASHCQPVHFRETLHDAAAPRSMTFDYQLRPGVATTTNALQLLRIVGLVEPDESLD